MQKPPHSRLLPLPIIDELRLDTLKRRDSNQTLRRTSQKPRHHRHRPTNVALRIAEKSSVLIERHEPHTRFDAVANDQRRATSIPLRTKRRERELLTRGKALIELGPGFGELGWVGDGDFDGASGGACEDGAQGGGFVGGLFVL